MYVAGLAVWLTNQLREFCCNIVIDSNLLSSRCVFKVLLEFLSLINFSDNFHNFIMLSNLLKSN